MVNRKILALLLFGIVSLVLYLLIPLTILRSETLQIVKKDNDLIVFYNGQKVNRAKIKGNLNINNISISVKHKAPFIFRHIYPSYKNEVLVKDINKIYRLSSTSFLKDFLFLSSSYNVSDLKYPQLDSSVNISNISNFSSILLTSSNINDITINLDDEISYWTRPFMHHENTITIKGENIFANQVVQDSWTGIFGIFAIALIGSYLILLYILVLKGILAIPKSRLFNLVSSIHIPKKAYLLIVLAGAGFFLCYSAYTNIYILDSMPHSQDEVAYLFQSKIFANARVFSESLPVPIRQLFDNEFIINNGKWFGKYPPGTSIVLAIGHLLFKASYLVNPIIGAVSAFLVFFIAARLFSKENGLLSSLLFIFSPITLFISSSYFSHSLTLLTSLLFLYFLLTRRNVLSGAALGWVFITRPYNGAILLISLVFIIIFKAIKLHIKTLIFIGIGFLPFMLFSLIYNKITTGNPFIFAFQEYSSFDKIGFGPRGVETGLEFTFPMALNNFYYNILSLQDMLTGWPFLISFSLIPFAFFSKNKKTVIMLFIFIIIQMSAYFIYFARGTFYGPRYHYEIIPYILILSAEGALVLIHKTRQRGLILLLIVALTFFAILRTALFLPKLKEFNGMKPIHIKPNTTIKKPTLILVNEGIGWTEYGKYFINQSPFLDDEIIFAKYNNTIHKKNQTYNELLIKHFPKRFPYVLKNNILTSYK